jgi:hypothetical protein
MTSARGVMTAIDGNIVRHIVADVKAMLTTEADERQ